MSGDDAAIAAQRFTTAGTRPGGERTAARAVLEAAGIAAAHQLRHLATSGARAPVVRVARGVRVGATARVGARVLVSANAPSTRRLRRAEFAERLTAMSP